MKVISPNNISVDFLIGEFLKTQRIYHEYDIVEEIDYYDSNLSLGIFLERNRLPAFWEDPSSLKKLSEELQKKDKKKHKNILKDLLKLRENLFKFINNR